jgi:hypothetical protein
MNSERGHKNDPDATVYVLNSDRAEAEHAFFVRYSNGEIWMLDENREHIPEATFTKQ